MLNGPACILKKEINMSNLTLIAKKRPQSSQGLLNRLRREGRIPGIVYGLARLLSSTFLLRVD